MQYSEDAAKCLTSGLNGMAERDAVWFNPLYREAIDALIDQGLVVAGNQPNAQGQTNRIPLSLSPLGFKEARELRDGGA